MEDKKEGILVGMTSHVTRKRGLLSIAALSDATKGKVVADRGRQHKLATNFIATLRPSSEQVISVPDDERNQSEGV